MFDKPAAPAAAAPAATEGEKKKDGDGKPKVEETNPILHRIQEAILQVKYQIRTPLPRGSFGLMASPEATHTLTATAVSSSLLEQYDLLIVPEYENGRPSSV